MTTFTATAHTNIALIKYWGKSAVRLNLPATGSLSLTLDRFYTTTSVEFIDSPSDVFSLNGLAGDAATQKRVLEHIQIFRDLSGRTEKVSVCSVNHVNTNSGLASSASGFAALSLALTHAFALKIDNTQLSRLARQGSGSAARSIFKGLVLMHGGPQATHESAFAEPINSAFNDTLRMIVLECSQSEKTIGSREGMSTTSQNSIFYQAFLHNHPLLLKHALNAIIEKDFNTLGQCMEQSTMQMHATMLGCSKPFWYFNPTTLLAINEVRSLRERGYQCYFTMDAGPHVKVLCQRHEVSGIANTLSEINGVSNTTVCTPGPGAFLHGA